MRVLPDLRVAPVPLVLLELLVLRVQALRVLLVFKDLSVMTALLGQQVELAPLVQRPILVPPDRLVLLPVQQELRDRPAVFKRAHGPRGLVLMIVLHTIRRRPL